MGPLLDVSCGEYEVPVGSRPPGAQDLYAAIGKLVDRGVARRRGRSRLNVKAARQPALAARGPRSLFPASTLCEEPSTSFLVPLVVSLQTSSSRFHGCRSALRSLMLPTRKPSRARSHDHVASRPEGITRTDLVCPSKGRIGVPTAYSPKRLRNQRHGSYGSSIPKPSGCSCEGRCTHELHGVTEVAVGF